MIPSINQKSKKIKTDHVILSQKKSFLGVTMVNKNPFLSGPEPSNQSELIHIILHIFVCSILIDSIIQSEFKKIKN